MTAPSVLDNVAGELIGRAFRGLAIVRRRKPVHPRGEVFEAELTLNGSFPATGAPLLSAARSHRAVVRFSRALGLPRPLPDFFGAAIRIPDAHGAGRHQDFLLVTSADRPVLHHVLIPTRAVGSRPYSSLAPYRIGGRTVVFGLIPAGDDRYDFCAAEIGDRFTRVGELHVGCEQTGGMDDEPFNVWNTGGGIEPATFVNRIRKRAYAQSQRGWRTGGRR